MRRLIRLVLAAIVVSIAIVAAFVGFRIWSAHPRVSGTATVRGLGADVEILRDSDGVPHIRARSGTDALFGLGYAHAQDRLWQMEFQRRAAAGRLAEILGPPALDADRLFRTLGIRRAARSAVQHLDSGTRGGIDAYVAGVNAFIQAHRGRLLPVEFAIFGIDPENWEPEDVIGWTKMMAWSLDTSWRRELLRAAIAARVGPERAGALMPVYTPDGPAIVEEFRPTQPADVSDDGAAESGNRGRQNKRKRPARTAGAVPQSSEARVSGALAADLLRVDDAVRSITGLGLPGSGSNSFVVAGSRTASGKPLLANDPHLASQMPSVWYLAHVTGGSMDAIGATLPGVPAIIIGRNQRIAWGLTNVMADVQDLYIERFRDWRTVEYQGVHQPVAVLRERIRVKGERDETLAIRVTRHGPIVSDVIRGAQEALALRWTALDDQDSSAVGFMSLSTATNWNDFTAAATRIRSPMQNIIYADVDGNIGYYAPGALPIRAAGDGTTPVPGWTGSHEWIGYVPFADLPNMLNPAAGFIVTANNKAMPDAYPYAIGSQWEPPYRAARMRERVQAKARLSPADVADIHADVQSGQAAVLLRVRDYLKPQKDQERRALQLLRGWDGAMRPDSAAAAVYRAWLNEIPRALFGDEIGPEVLREYLQDTRDLALALHLIVHDLARGAESSWCDDMGTAGRERCADTFNRAFAHGVANLMETQGGNVEGWQLGPMNTVVFAHPPFESVGALRWLFSRRVHAPGDRFTVNPVMFVRDRVVISSYRQIVDLSGGPSRFILSTGQSGRLWSSHYDDMLPLWLDVNYVPMRFMREEVDRDVRERLVLKPER